MHITTQCPNAGVCIARYKRTLDSVDTGDTRCAYCKFSDALSFMEMLSRSRPDMEAPCEALAKLCIKDVRQAIAADAKLDAQHKERDANRKSGYLCSVVVDELRQRTLEDANTHENSAVDQP
jgi:hypothetical protein